LGSDDYRYEHGRVCHNLPVRQDYLDAVVWDHMMALLADPRLIRAEIDRRLEESKTTSPITAQRSSLERALRRAERAIERLVAAYQEALITLEELRARMPDLRKKVTTLCTQLEALAAQAVDRETFLQLAETLEAFLVRLRQAAQDAPLSERQRILRLLVREVLGGPEHVVIRHSIRTSKGSPDPGYRLRGRGHLAAPGQRVSPLCL
jgi:site-specific DNA recombinase